MGLWVGFLGFGVPYVNTFLDLLLKGNHYEITVSLDTSKPSSGVVIIVRFPSLLSSLIVI